MSAERDCIFICYRREDSEDFASRIFDELARCYGRERIFKDVDSLLPGIDWLDHLNARIGQSAIAIVVIGEEWLDCRGPDGKRRLENVDDHVAHEISRVLGEKIPVIPLLIDSTPMPASSQLPETIQPLVRRQNFTIRRDQHFRNDARLLIENLDRLFSAIPKSQAAIPSPVIPASATDTVRKVEPGAEPLPLRSAARLNPVLFFFGWLFSALLLPIPWVGVRAQRWILERRALSVENWEALTRWAAPLAMMLSIMVLLHLAGGFGRPRMWSPDLRLAKDAGVQITDHYLSIDVAPAGTNGPKEMRVYVELEWGNLDRFSFGLMAACPLSLLLILQWGALRQLLRLAWLWLLPGPLLFAIVWLGDEDDSEVAQTWIIYILALHTLWQAILLLSLPLKTKSADPLPINPVA